MQKILLLLCLVLPGVAFANGPIILSGPDLAKVFDDQEDFVSDRYIFAPSGALVTSSQRGTPLTVSGPATTVCDATKTPLCWTAPAGTVPVGPDGALVYGARTSRLLWNQDLSNAVWIKRGDAACVASPEPAPDGTMTAWRCTVAVNGTDDLFQTTAGNAASAPLTTAVWLRPVDISEATRLAMNNANGTVYGQARIDLSSISGWARIGPTHPAMTLSVAYAATPGGAGGVRFYSYDGPTLTFDIWRPWQVEGADAGPDAEVGQNPLSVGAMKITGTNGLSTGAWYVRMRAKPEGDWAAINRGMFTIGMVGANSAWLYASTSGRIAFTVRDGNNTNKFISAAHGFTPGSEHEIEVSVSEDGTGEIRLDGISKVTGPVGVITTIPSALTIGAVATSYFGGSIREVTLCRTSNPERCQ